MAVMGVIGVKTVIKKFKLANKKPVFEFKFESDQLEHCGQGWIAKLDCTIMISNGNEQMRSFYSKKLMNQLILSSK